MSQKQIEAQIKQYLPKLDWYKPKGLPRGARWSIKPDPKKNFAIAYEEGPEENGSYTYKARMPFELILEVTETYPEPKEVGDPDRTSTLSFGTDE